jgi:hypothetical protein
MSWEDHESKSLATAGDGTIYFDFIPHNSSFNLAAQRLAVSSSAWLDVLRLSLVDL